ncbi:MAG: hypothetical protein K9I34_04985 [Bacteroidales bacterium]|nr:hypothetical protein [Bacteroidales bacterium]
MSVTIEEVKTAKQRKIFIKFPYHLHKNHRNWLPPVYEEEKSYFHPDKNSYFKENEVVLFLAYREHKPVGRIMGLIHQKYNEEHQENAARFAFFECENNQESADALFAAVASWAKERRKDVLIGPFAFSDKDPQGFLIEGFDAPPVVTSNSNPAYFNHLVESGGFKPMFDLVAYDITIPDKVPDFYERIYNRISLNNGFVVKEFTSRKEMKPYILPIFELTNETFREIYGFQPVKREEALHFADQYLPLLNPAFVKVIEKDDKVVAYVVGMPDISEGLKKSKGRLYPFGVLRILRAASKTRRLVLLIGAVKEQYRGLGLDVLLGKSIIESAIKLKYKHIDSHLELETNVAVRAEMERMNGKVYKRFRVYKRPL